MFGRHTMGWPGIRGRHRGWPHMHGFGFGQSERGSVKFEILTVLSDGPRHGYDIMLAIEERRGYRPSPGSIYPALQMLEDEDFIRGQEADGKRVYTITEKGNEHLKNYRESRAESESGGADHAEGVEMMARGMRSFHGVKDAVRQIARSGDLPTLQRAVEILERTRRELYAILAEG
jgi:DNA-binding PadR family transcriptional regulator